MAKFAVLAQFAVARSQRHDSATDRATTPIGHHAMRDPAQQRTTRTRVNQLKSHALPFFKSKKQLPGQTDFNMVILINQCKQ